MGVFTYEFETTSVIPPARLFKAIVLDSDNLILKIAPQAINSIEIVQGNGGPGTIKKVNFGEGSQHKYSRQRVEEIDLDNFTYNFTEIRGNVLGDSLGKISIETKLEASSDGVTVMKSSITYYTKGYLEINEERVKEDKEKSSQFFKTFEAYLLANLEAYN